MTFTETAERLTAIVDQLCLRLRGRQPNGMLVALWLDGPVLVLVHNTLKKIARDFAAVAARLDAGTLRRPAPRTPSATPRKPPDSQKPRLAWPYRLPNTPYWLVRLFQPSTYAAGALYQFFHLPELQALLVAAPQLRRIIRPLCTALDVEQPKPSEPVPPERPKPARRRRTTVVYPFAPHLWRPADPAFSSTNLTATA